MSNRVSDKLNCCPVSQWKDYYIDIKNDEHQNYLTRKVVFYVRKKSRM